MRNPSSEAAPNRLASPVPLTGSHPVTDWKWAQARVNFVIVVPRPGSGWTVAEPTVRGESPSHHSTVRYWIGDGKRRLRVKQYFHDWWIPTIADISFRAPGHPVVHGPAVAFVGRDYRRHEASCGHKWGTGVEFSLESGTMDNNDWSALWNDLDSVDPDAVVEARAATFARRNYWNRWRRVMAPWNTTEISSLAWTDPTSESMEAAAWALTADRWAPVPGTIDSIGARKGPQGDEAQFVFRWPMTLDVSAWLRVLREPPEPWRPLIDSGEVNPPKWETVRVGGLGVERASMDPTVGNWFFAWREGAKAYELHLRARPGLSAEPAGAVVKGLTA